MKHDVFRSLHGMEISTFGNVMKIRWKCVCLNVAGVLITGLPGALRI